jgi:AraC-like DNA-binding protein
MEYIQRLQQAIDYAESHLEECLDIGALSGAACYSRSHFIWLFELATGMGPMEYVRRRRLARAAADIAAGEGIMDSALRYGFSSQDAFTRSFHDEFGIPPGKYRKTPAGSRPPLWALRLRNEGADMNLKVLVASYSGESRVAMERFLTEEVRKVVAEVAEGRLKAGQIDPEVLAELVAMRVMRVEDGKARLATSVFLEPDMNLFRETAASIGERLALAVEAEGEGLRDDPPEARSYVAGILGLVKHYGKALAEAGKMSSYKDLEGRYGRAKADFDELCDAYDSYGPDFLLVNTNRGERYTAVAIGPSSESFFSRLLEWRKSAKDEGSYAFASGLTTFLTDSFAMLAEGSMRSPALMAAAESTRMAEGDRVLAVMIPKDEEERCARIASRIGGAVQAVGRETAGRAFEVLKLTTSGRQGVAPEDMMLNFGRYIRKLASKRLYRDGYFTDKIPDSGLATVFYENSCSLIDVMA